MAIEGHDLPMEQQGARRQCTNGGSNFWTQTAIFVIPRKKGDSVAFLVSKNPISVVLLLIYPRGLIKRFRNECRKHRVYAKRNSVFYHGTPCMSTYQRGCYMCELGANSNPALRPELMGCSETLEPGIGRGERPSRRPSRKPGDAIRCFRGLKSQSCPHPHPARSARSHLQDRRPQPRSVLALPRPRWWRPLYADFAQHRHEANARIPKPHDPVGIIGHRWQHRHNVH